MIKIHAISALKDNYIWIVVNTKAQCALIVDPGEASPVISYLQHHQLELKGILITHHHWDHVNGVTELHKRFNVPVYGSVRSLCNELTHRVDEGDAVLINDNFPVWRVMSIPGHTLDHIAYIADNIVFCGDTLFGAGCGRLFEGTAEQLYQSLQKLADLPDDTNIYCAHEYTLNNLYFAKAAEPGNQHIIQRIDQVNALRQKNIPSIPSLLREEKQTNPFLRCTSVEIIQQVEKHTKRVLKEPIDVFAALREWKNTF